MSATAFTVGLITALVGPVAPCAPSGSAVVRSTPQVAVYRLVTGEVRACGWGGDYQLVEAKYDDIFGPPAVAINGPYVAYADDDYSDPDDTGESYVWVLDTSQPVSHQPDALNPDTDAPPGPGIDAKVVSVRLTTTGTVAFATCAQTTIPAQFRNGPGTQCHRRGRLAQVAYRRFHGDTEILATSRKITASSLRLAGLQLTWRKAGRRIVHRIPA